MGTTPLGATLGLQTVLLDQPTPAPLAEHRRLVIDVDLHNIDKVRALRRLLSDAVDRELIFVVRDKPPARAERVQAEALGATQVLPREDVIDDGP